MAGDVDPMSLPFEEAIRFFKDKLTLPTQFWDDILKAAHDRAFIVAGAAKADLLADLQAAVTRVIDSGITLEEFQKDFFGLVQKHGWTGWTGETSVGGRAWRTQVIYDTNLFTSYAAGRWEQLRKIKSQRPYWEYRHSDLSVHPRPLHVAWDGLVLEADDPWWLTHYPPNGWGCKCRVFALSMRDLEKDGKSGPDKAPNDGVYLFKDRDGNEHILPNGIDYGWDYVPGQNAAERNEMLLDEKLKRLFGKTPPAAIAHGAKPDSVERVLEDFLKSFGESVPGFQSLTYDIGGDFKMATFGDGRYYWPDPTIAAQYEKPLREALQKIRRGQELTVDEESMIKTLWHEIGHNRQTQLRQRIYKKDSITEKLLETVNEFIALRTYPQFLRAIGGGEAKFRAGVRAVSGYGTWVNRLEALMQRLGLDPATMLPAIERVSFTQALDAGGGDDILNHLAEELAGAGRKAGWKKLSKPMVRAVLKMIDEKPEDFGKALVNLFAKRPPP